jgi:2-hydroxy-6-oxonona-2,4-dienedioate hydrolase/4,5:9,10-diseco-3-hydroxy-5,9,17-trioxoandrosta-1(10),2-diene-4-oate hydrolase
VKVDEKITDQRLVRVGTRDIAVTERGTGEPVVLLHGGGPGASGMSNYVRNVDALAQRFRVVVPDLPGYGRSSKHVDQADPFGDLAAAVRGLLDALGIDRAHLVGNSYGGAAALRLALDRPDRVARMVLMGPGGIGTTRHVPTPGLKQLFGYYGGGPSRAKIERFIRDYLVYDGASVTAQMIDERHQASIDPDVVANPPLRRPAGLHALLKMDLARDKRLSRLATPTLVLWGANDKVNRPSGGRLLAERMPRCDLYLVAKTGHWVQWERPHLFNTLTVAFLSEDSK